MKIFILVALMSLLTSCVSTQIPVCMQPINLIDNPITHAVVDPEMSRLKLRTFTVYPASSVDETIRLNEIEERQLLYFLRCQLERNGYKYVDPIESPDMFITLVASTDYKETYIPPSVGTRLKYIPGTTSTTTTTSSGRASASAYGNGGWGFGSGTFSGNTISTTTTPGSLTTEDYIKPGYTVGHYYPTVGIFAYDSTGEKLIWSATGTGTSMESDVRISSQLVITGALEGIPFCDPSISLVKQSSGVVGLQYMILTNDGNNYFPVILDVIQGGPAYNAGIMRFDWVLNVDGVDCKNINVEQFHDLLSGQPGSNMKVTVWRNGRAVSKSLTRVDRSKLYK